MPFKIVAASSPLPDNLAQLLTEENLLFFLGITTKESLTSFLYEIKRDPLYPALFILLIAHRQSPTAQLESLASTQREEIQKMIDTLAPNTHLWDPQADNHNSDELSELAEKLPKESSLTPIQFLDIINKGWNNYKISHQGIFTFDDIKEAMFETTLDFNQPKRPRSESPRGYGGELAIRRGWRKTGDWLADVIRFEPTIELAYQDLYPTPPRLEFLVKDFLGKVALYLTQEGYLLRNQLYLEADESPAALKAALHLLDTHLRSTEAHPIVENLIRHCRSDIYPASQIDPSLDSLPANGHADNNQDTVKTGTLTNGGKVTDMSCIRVHNSNEDFNDVAIFGPS